MRSCLDFKGNKIMRQRPQASSSLRPFFIHLKPKHKGALYEKIVFNWDFVWVFNPV